LKQHLTRIILPILVAFYLMNSSAYAQQGFSYVEQKDDSAFLAQLKKDIKRQYDKDSLGIKGENKKYLLQFYRERYTAIANMFAEGEVVGLAQANTYLNQLTQAILNSNPQLQLPPTRFLFNRAYWPNAASFGEGTIIFNIGLVYQAAKRGAGGICALSRVGASKFLTIATMPFVNM
jgi:hypothetical protein